MTLQAPEKGYVNYKNCSIVHSRCTEVILPNNNIDKNTNNTMTITNNDYSPPYL